MDIRIVHNLDWILATRLRSPGRGLRRGIGNVPGLDIGISADTQERCTKCLGGP
jgi:hypothetical protein